MLCMCHAADKDVDEVCMESTGEGKMRLCDYLLAERLGERESESEA